MTTYTARSTAPARATIVAALNLSELAAADVTITVETGDYFKGSWCEHDGCTHPAAASVTWVDTEDGQTEQMVCGDCAADAVEVVRQSTAADLTEDMTVRVSPYWLLYVHHVAA
ncbi:hypothetical protein [Nocardia farcinica]|uniref:hypothetical protein n=1 Tax=Nocardia farcinica TaxID=37329 RepID=UPI0015F026C3|nr:hypothetical protein [Nocardia farcinica]MBA4858032.1 hypothetical protein [Nocardia farcinica]MBC9819437.1 hypothetical protein [Nocardia farcinica]